MQWLAIVWIALWGTFSIPWTTATSTPHWERVRPPRIRAQSRVRADHVLNVLFYVPVVPIGSRLGRRVTPLVVAGVMLSVTAETMQLFSAERDPDGNDLLANTAGTIIGAAVVLLWRRRQLR